jgi:hypothetical protein
MERGSFVARKFLRVDLPAAREPTSTPLRLFGFEPGTVTLPSSLLGWMWQIMFLLLV